MQSIHWWRGAFQRMVLDVVILDTDHHLGNFGVLFDTDTMEIQTIAPVFDNNRSLLFDLNDDQMDHAERYNSAAYAPARDGFCDSSPGFVDRCHPRRPCEFAGIRLQAASGRPDGRGVTGKAELCGQWTDSENTWITGIVSTSESHRGQCCFLH